MNFVRSYFFPNATLTSFPFLLSKLDSRVIKTLEGHFFTLSECLILMKEMGNWSELHSEKSDFLQNPYFSAIYRLHTELEAFLSSSLHLPSSVGQES